MSGAIILVLTWNWAQFHNQGFKSYGVDMIRQTDICRAQASIKLLSINYTGTCSIVHKTKAT